MTFDGFIIDPAAVSWLRQQIKNLKADLDSGAAMPGMDSASMGDSRVAHALDQFIGNWRDGRAQIVAKLDIVCQQLGDALATYEDVDQTTSTALSGEAP